MVVEPKHAIAAVGKKRVASLVTPLVLSLEMLRTVDLNNQSSAMTDEIDDEWTDRILPPKAHAIEPMSAHAVPDDPLGVGQISP